MWRQRFVLKEFGQPVLLFGKAGASIEISFISKDLLPQCNYTVAGEFLAGKCADNIQHGLEGILLIKNCKGNKQAKTGGVDAPVQARSCMRCTAATVSG